MFADIDRYLLSDYQIRMNYGGNDTKEAAMFPSFHRLTNVWMEVPPGNSTVFQSNDFTSLSLSLSLFLFFYLSVYLSLSVRALSLRLSGWETGRQAGRQAGRVAGWIDRSIDRSIDQLIDR